MKVQAFILSSIVTIAGLSSCKTLVYIQKQYEPEIATEIKPATIVFINNFNYTNPDIVKKNRQRTYARAVSGFTKGFLKGMGAGDSIKVVIGDTLRKETAPGMLTALLPVETVSDICTGHEATMLVVLDSILMEFYNKEDYLTSYEWINFYSRRFFLYTEFFLTAYARNGDLINRSSVNRTFFYAWRMSLLSGLALNPSLAGAFRRIDNAAIPAGGDYASKFFHSTERLERSVYSGGYLRGSARLMKSGEWEKAVKTLEDLSASPNKSIAKKARANLEVAMEGAGR